jgi:hypothetical protein
MTNQQARSLTGSAYADESRDTTPPFDLISLVTGNLTALLMKMVPGKPNGLKSPHSMVSVSPPFKIGGTISPRVEKNRQ